MPKQAKRPTRKEKAQMSKVVQLNPERAETSAAQTTNPIIMEDSPMAEAKVEEEVKTDAPKDNEPGWLSRNIKMIAGVTVGIVIGIAAAAIYIATGTEISVPDSTNPDQV